MLLDCTVLNLFKFLSTQLKVSSVFSVPFGSNLPVEQYKNINQCKQECFVEIYSGVPKFCTQ